MKHPFCLASIYLAGLSLSIVLSGCDQATLFSPYERARVILPPPHPAIAISREARADAPSGDYWTLAWFDESGVFRSIQHIPASAESVTIDLRRGSFTPVLLYPESGGLALAPAGAIYPIDGSAEPAEAIRGEVTLKPDWKGGILADCAYEACQRATGGFSAGQAIAAHFNWARCARVIDAMPDPVLLDRETLVAAILSGSVSKYSVSERDAAIISLDSIHRESGERFVAANPVSADFIWPAEGAPAVTLADGHATYFGEKGTIELEVKGGTLVCGFFSTYPLQD
ncbi:MAG TPA: hypothetical protein PKO22_02435 [Treponemataceae bacterium]|nr:hypothetical protein [Treponemataceae bacterium]